MSKKPRFRKGQVVMCGNNAGWEPVKIEGVLRADHKGNPFDTIAYDLHNGDTIPQDILRKLTKREAGLK